MIEDILRAAETSPNSLQLKQHLEPYIEIIELLKQHKIPEAYPEDDAGMPIFHNKTLGTGSLYARDDIIRLSGYCFLSHNWLRPLANWIGRRSCLEIMCGSGSLSKVLQDYGVNIKATDDFSWGESQGAWFREPWTTVEEISAIDAIRKYGKETDLLICVWPYMDDGCYDALMEMRSINPNTQMIFIGEYGGGATANDAFFGTAEVVNDQSFYDAVAKYRAAFGLHDRPVLVK